MIRRLAFVVVSLAFVVASPAAEAQQPTRTWRIGFLAARPVPAYDALWGQLRILGYVEGQNLIVERRWWGSVTERATETAAELVRAKVDLIVTANPQAAHAALRATRTIPIVMIAVADPVASGLVASLARPGGNATGLTWDTGYEISDKMLQLLKEAAPAMTRTAVLWSRENPHHPAYVKRLETAARQLRVKLVSYGLARAEEIDGAFRRMHEARVDGLVVMPHWAAHAKRVVELAEKNRLPAIYGARFFDGGLMFYGPDHRDLFQRAALYVDRILKGANPGDVPMEQPVKFETVVDLRTAKALGLNLPPSLVLRADHVIE